MSTDHLRWKVTPVLRAYLLLLSTCVPPASKGKVDVKTAVISLSYLAGRRFAQLKVTSTTLSCWTVGKDVRPGKRRIGVSVAQEKRVVCRRERQTSYIGIEIGPNLTDFSARPIAEEIRGVRNGKSIIFPNQTAVLVNGHQLLFVFASELSSTDREMLVGRRSIGRFPHLSP